MVFIIPNNVRNIIKTTCHSERREEYLKENKTFLEVFCHSALDAESTKKSKLSFRTT